MTKETIASSLAYFPTKSEFEAICEEYGITYIEDSPDGNELRCNICGADWSPGPSDPDNIEVQWWMCPNGCNEDLEVDIE